jgi:hypothetical protein
MQRLPGMLLSSFGDLSHTSTLLPQYIATLEYLNSVDRQIAKTKRWYSNYCFVSTSTSSPSPIVPLASNINIGPE